MKKMIAILVIFVCVGTALSAQDSGMSFGGGALLDWSFSNGLKAKLGDVTYYSGLRNMSFGAYAFFDITYAEIDVSFAYGSITIVDKEKGGPQVKNDTENGGSVLQIGLSLLGKYPINLGKITVFPLLGVGYNIVLTAKDADGDKMYDKDSDSSAMKDLSQFSILGGGGFDYNINKNIYLRVSGLLQMRFPSKMQKDYAQELGNPFKATLGFGPVIKVGIGYRF